MQSREEMASEGSCFEQFDVATDFADHFFAKCISKNHNYLTDSSGKLFKRIMREWRMLEKDLPDAIYVRVYENRMDLLRAVIIGAPKTPYHDGLYFFDIQFPCDYPDAPPAVRYLSLGLRINPNLYSNGRICLSLLNTWNGKGNERWNPTSSTILQVLVSLQGLVLNEKPYYNEPGIKPASSSTSYNEDVFFLCCKSTLYLLRNPPKNFEDFVSQHFKNRARTILRACQAYTCGCVRVGYFTGDDAGSNSNLEQILKIKVSRGFRRKIQDIHPQLFSAFTKIGASLEDLPEDLKVIAHASEDEKSSSFRYHHVMRKFKLFLGLGKEEKHQ